VFRKRHVHIRLLLMQLRIPEYTKQLMTTSTSVIYENFMDFTKISPWFTYFHHPKFHPQYNKASQSLSTFLTNETHVTNLLKYTLFINPTLQPQLPFSHDWPLSQNTRFLIKIFEDYFYILANSLKDSPCSKHNSKSLHGKPK